MSVRIDSSADQLYRSSSLPSKAGGATICGWFSALTPQTSTIDDYLLVYDNISGDYAIFCDDDGSNFGSNNQCLTANGGVSYFGSTPAANTPFFGAMTINAGSVTVYRRVQGENALSATASLSVPTSGAWTSFEIGCNITNTGEFSDAAIWNVKCWDRVLTTAELLIESYYRRVVYPSSINFHCPLDTHTDLNDYSGNGRTLTSAGTLTTEQHGEGLWRPRRRLLVQSATVAPPQTMQFPHVLAQRTRRHVWRYS